MNKTSQIRIIDLQSRIAISGPFHPGNNEVYRGLGGQYSKEDRRWILPSTVDCKAKLAELFGKKSRNVVTRVAERDLSICEEKLVVGGHVVASWDSRNETIRMPDGVEIATGDWDLVGSKKNGHPCKAGYDLSLKVVVRKDFAETHGLNIEEELDDEELPHPLQPYANSDLAEELERRGYRVEKPAVSLF